MSIVLTPVSSGYNLSVINSNFNTTQEYINNNLLHRTGDVAGQAQMKRDLDMDSNNILNAYVGDIPLSEIAEQTQAVYQALANGGYGYITVDSFEQGYTLLYPNQVLRFEATGEYYRWDGGLSSFPKVIPAGSTPQSTGGIGKGLWVSVGDASLRSALTSDTGYTLIPSLYVVNSEIPVEAFRADGLTDDQVIQSANNAAALAGASLIFPAKRTYNITSVTATTKWKSKSTILKRNLGTSSPMITMGTGSGLDGFTIDGSRENAGVVSTILIGNVEGVELSNNSIINAPEHAVSVLNQTSTSTRAPNSIHGNKIYNVLGAGIYLFNAEFTRIRDNDVHNCGNGILGQGNSRHFNGVEVTGNFTHNNTGSGIGFILITEEEDQQAYEKILISKNRVYGNSSTGIAVQADKSVVTDNHVWNNGSETYHQGILVNANSVMVSNNIITGNAGVGIDFGDCRKCTATSNFIEENGWIGIEVNSSEQMTVIGNVINRNFAGKPQADLQAGILLHKGVGGYPFLGDNRDISVIGNTILGGDGQKYAILVADSNSYNITIVGNVCKLAAYDEDIQTRSSNVVIENNVTRWDPMDSAMATIASGGFNVPSVARTVQVNGSGSVIFIGILNDAAYIKDRYVRVYAVTGFTLENSGAYGTGNLFLGSSVILSAGDSIDLWSNGSGGWKRA